MKLDTTDKRLLSYLFHNFRSPITKIAKKCRISREQAEYRIKKYEKEGLIRKYLAIFDLYALGYNKNYILRLRVKNPKLDKLSQIKQNGNVLILTKLQCYGPWDYILTILTKERSTVLDFISELYDSWKEELLDYEFFEPLELYFFPLKVFGETENDSLLSFYETERVKIDIIDQKIIEEISKKANIRIVELAEIIGEKVETTNYRLKKLEKKVIKGYRLFLDLDKINYKLAQVVLKLNNLSNLNKKKVLSYSSKKNIHASGFGIGKYNVLFQIIYESPSELAEQINEIKKNFSENLIDYELIHIEKELQPQTI